ncbi:MAG: hypothetical protein RR614_02795 [Eubacterium sp.]
MFKNKKKDPWDFSEETDFKKTLLEKMKSVYSMELSDDDIKNVVGGAGADQNVFEPRCLYWKNEEGEVFAGCINCQNKSCKGV